MPTHRRTWQRSEERVADLFNCRRQPGSGSNGRDDVLTTSDSTHETLYIESKYRVHHDARTLHDKARKKAEKEKKVPLVALHSKGRHGFLLVIHDADFKYVAAQFVAALDPEGRDEMDSLIEAARNRAIKPGGKS